MNHYKQFLEVELVDAIDIYRGKWKNLWLTSRGQFPSIRTYSSEEEALESAKIRMERLENLSKQGKRTVNVVHPETDTFLYYFPQDHVTVIQIPYKGD